MFIAVTSLASMTTPMIRIQRVIRNVLSGKCNAVKTVSITPPC